MPKLSELVAKAARRPYEIELDDGTVVEVPQPTLGAWQAAPFGGDVGEFLAHLGVGGDDAARVQEVMAQAPLGTADELLSSMRGHFGLGN